MEMVQIPKADYEAIISAREELEDILAFDRAMVDRGDGLPHDFMLRLIKGENALRVFREWRGFSQSALSRASRVHRVQIADIEAGRANASVQTWKKLAEALDVEIGELV
ncbi:MAG: helix-turn-helix transcriptional regulator [Nitratireductor sp.]